MDLGSLPDWLSFVANGVMATAAVVALTTWRREVLGRKRIETAQDALLAVYAIIPKLRQARKSAVIPDGPLDTDAASHLRALANETADAIKDLEPDIAAIERIQRSVRAHLGAGEIAATTELLMLILRLRLYANSLAVSIEPGSVIGKPERIVFMTSDDRTDQDLDDLLGQFNRAVGMHLR